MLMMKLCLDKASLHAACKAFGRLYSEAFYLYMAVNGGEVSARALFEVKSAQACAAGYEGPEDDTWLFDGMLRAGFHYAGEQGIETGAIPEEFRYRHRKKFEQLNYPATQTFNIVNFFQKYKNCVRLD